MEISERDVDFVPFEQVEARLAKISGVTEVTAPALAALLVLM